MGNNKSKEESKKETEKIPFTNEDFKNLNEIFKAAQRESAEDEQQYTQVIMLKKHIFIKMENINEEKTGKKIEEK